jgi:hypothetical protein
MNQLFDRIETHLKGHPMQHFLKSHFGGKSLQQIISKVGVPRSCGSFDEICCSLFLFSCSI